MTGQYKPVILIGAARSGTKLVRDLIASHPAIDRVPYDINYIWRLGNEKLAHDELWPDLLTPCLRRQIQRGFGRYHAGAPFLIEKTVCNCLRVAYVRAVFPEARFIHLVRDGLDVLESVYRQWLAPPDWRYMFNKVRTYPLAQAPGYALAYAAGVFHRALRPGQNGTGTWGPRYAGIDQDVADKDLLEVCAIQWARSVEKALEDLARVPADHVLTIRYEEFVRAPRQYLTQSAGFLGIDPQPYSRLDLSPVSSGNIGKGRGRLSAEDLSGVLPHMEQALTLLGYGVGSRE
jgi:hypothetical protein